MKKTALLTLLFATLILLLVGCGKSDPTLIYVVDGETFHEDVLEDEDEIFDRVTTLPTKEGFYFGGWFYDEGTWQRPLDYGELNEKKKDDTVYRVYAKWEVIAVSYDEIERTYTVTGLLAGAGDVVEIPARYGDLPITAIAPEAFRGNSTMTTVKIPDTVKTIGEYAFAECTALTEITLPNTVSTVERGAFSNCISLQKASLSTAMKKLSVELFFGCRSLSSVNLPQAITEIGPRVFAGCAALPTLSLPLNVRTIGAEALAQTALTEITFAGTRERWQSVTKTDFAKNSSLITVRCLDGDEDLFPEK